MPLGGHVARGERVAFRAGLEGALRTLLSDWRTGRGFPQRAREKPPHRFADDHLALS